MRYASTVSQWNSLLSPSQIDAQFALMAKLDPRMARESRQFWESRNKVQLAVLRRQAWDSCDGDQYQLAASYLALKAQQAP